MTLLGLFDVSRGSFDALIEIRRQANCASCPPVITTLITALSDAPQQTMVALTKGVREPLALEWGKIFNSPEFCATVRKTTRKVL